MSQSLSITSLSNPRVKALVRLRQRAEDRRSAGQFLIETRRELHRAIDAGFRLVELYVREQQAGESWGELARIAGQAGVTAVSVSDAVLEKIAYRENPQGFVAVMSGGAATLDALHLPDPPLVIVLSGLEKPGNVGAIARTAEAAGVSAMLIDSPGYDLFNPNCIRAPTGAIFGLPIVCDTAANLRAFLKSQNIVTIALTPEAEFTHLQLPLRGPVAVIVGSEDQGLDDDWKSHADVRVSIPMRTRTVDSLNVSVSAAVLLFEAMRQRAG